MQIDAQRLRVLGYSRAEFGSGWGHAVDPDTGATCTTRELVLSRTFRTDDCGKGEGRSTMGVEMKDPYTGALITADDVDIDHIIPLAAAWDMGAWRWDSAKRRQFANDTDLNLVAVASAINRDKSDAALGQWLPPHPGVHCAYAAQYLRIATTYGLSITQQDAAAARHACLI